MKKPSAPGTNSRIHGLAALTVGSILLAGCASFSEGVTRAVINSQGESEDTRECHIRGGEFEGLASKLDRLEVRRDGRSSDDALPALKILFVHGIGGPSPGYSTRLRENLITRLDLPVTEERPKTIRLMDTEQTDADLGVLTIYRYLSSKLSRELLFYELTWSSITAPIRADFEAAETTEFARRGATINQTLKDFMNSRASDPMLYMGSERDSILASVDEGICWMLVGGWERLPRDTRANCDPAVDADPEIIDRDELVFMSNSLGSRILVDTLMRSAQRGRGQWEDPDDPRVKALAELTPAQANRINALVQEFADRDFTFFMLSNQLPLLNLGQPAPAITNQIEAYCSADGEKRDQRFAGIKIVSFTDPNDLLSYNLPPDFADTELDSRLCPSVVNVNIMLVQPRSLLGLGDFANPMTIHSGYDNDDRVLSMITRGVGTMPDDVVSQGDCQWMRTVDNP